MKIFLLFIVSIVVSCTSDPSVGTTHVPNLLKGSAKNGTMVYLVNSKSVLSSNVIDSQIVIDGEYAFNLKNSGDYFIYALKDDSVSMVRIQDYNSDDGFVSDLNEYKKTNRTTFATSQSSDRVFIEGVPSSLVTSTKEISVVPLGKYNMYISSKDTTGLLAKSAVQSVNITGDSVIHTAFKVKDLKTETIIDSLIKVTYRTFSWDSNLCNMKPDNIVDLEYFIVDSAKSPGDLKEFDGCGVDWKLDNVRGVSFVMRKGAGKGIVTEFSVDIMDRGFADFKIGDDNNTVKCGYKFDGVYQEKFVTIPYDMRDSVVSLAIQYDGNDLYWIVQGDIYFHVVSEFDMTMSPKIQRYISTKEWSKRIVGDTIVLPDSLYVRDIHVTHE